jgi:hypothetical protein
MPHDRDGAELKPGDRVSIPCVVDRVNPGTDYCNVTVHTESNCFPGDYPTVVRLNSQQVVKVATPDTPPDEPIPDENESV